MAGPSTAACALTQCQTAQRAGPREASLQTRGGDTTPAELLQILRDAAAHSLCQQLRRSEQWPQDWKRSVIIPILKQGNVQECSNYRTIALLSQASKVIVKILQGRLQQYVNREPPDVQAQFRKGRGIRDQTANFTGPQKKQESPKTPAPASLTTLMPVTVWITANYGKS